MSLRAVYDVSSDQLDSKFLWKPLRVTTHKWVDAFYFCCARVEKIVKDNIYCGHFFETKFFENTLLKTFTRI